MPYHPKYSHFTLDRPCTHCIALNQPNTSGKKQPTKGRSRQADRVTGADRAARAAGFRAWMLGSNVVFLKGTPQKSTINPLNLLSMQSIIVRHQHKGHFMRYLMYWLVISFPLWTLPALGSDSKSLEYLLPRGTTYDPSIPTPESFFGFSPGSWHIRHDQLVEYLRLLDRTSDRVALEEYGETYEHRPLILLTISHPENHRQMNTLRQQHHAMCFAEQTTQTNPDLLPAIVWMGFTVHGNEASGTNAAPLIAYYLAAAQGPELDSLLIHSIVLLDPCINPDGYARFSSWVNENKGSQPVSDPQTREHNEPWPSGRTNHYWFDLNRDYLSLVHVESRARMQKYWKWIPHVLLDFHEMGTQSTYFFQPGRPSAVHSLIPESNKRFTQQFAQSCATALDSIGSLYFTREIFDDFFIGKGSTYADLAGSIGILFEQASARGHRQQSQDRVLEFADAIRNHVTSALSCLHTAEQLRRDLNRYQQAFFASALDESKHSSVQGYVLDSPQDKGTLGIVADLLLRHNIRVYRLAREYRTVGKTFSPASALYVPLTQPNFRLLTALMERRKSFSDSIFYDISTWSLPLAHNLSVVEVRSASESLAGERVLFPPETPGTYRGSANPAAYAFSWQQIDAPRVLYRLLTRGIKVRVAMQPFASAVGSTDAVQFDRGTIIIPRGIQTLPADSLRNLLLRAVDENHIQVYGLMSSLSAQGVDLGSDRFKPIEKPNVLILAGTGVNATDAGEVWYTLDKETGLAVSLAEPSSLARLLLERYSVIIAPGGNYGGTDSADIATLRSWTERGGTLITIERASEWASKNHLTTLRIINPATRQKDSVVVRRPFEDMGKSEAAQQVNGAILETLLDRTHPLGFGYSQDRLAVSRSSNLVLESPKDPYATPLVYTKDPLLSGYMSVQNEKAIRGTGSAAVSTSGTGRVICLMDNPVFRGYWLGTERILLNALFFSRCIPLLPGQRDR